MYDKWLRGFAILTAVATFLLMIMGGLVTSKGAGLAVPDWPSTFGENMFLYPPSKMVGGIFYEHSHRLLGSLVGSLTIVLLVLIWIRDDRRWLRNVSIAAVIAVSIQGVMGGLRVTEISSALAVVHGVFAQAFFTLMVCIALFVSRGWVEMPRVNGMEGAQKLRRFGIAAVGAIYLQSIFGAFFRHTGGGLWLHLLAAIGVTVVTFELVRLVVSANAPRTIKRYSAGLVSLVILQLFLGLGAYMAKLYSPEPVSAPFMVVVMTVVHSVNGALILAASVVVALGLYRHLGRETGLEAVSA